ncbi:hypothetical protein [Paenibacillus sp. GYB003]|uniref:hypothetical protein n=1 Tax=Paenibacillus sp. GYB003 TaxID=2994392 RepID=UPI002F96C63D
MRNAIKAKLAADLADLSGRCFDIGEPTASTAKPYATVKLAEQSDGSPWLGRTSRFEVALYGEANAAAALDLLADQAVLALDCVKLTESSAALPDFTCRYAGTAASERIDEAAQALVRVLSFTVAAVGSGENAAPDAWLGALAAWTTAQAGADWRVYRTCWPQQYAIPAVMWRLGPIESADRNAAAAELRQSIVGHVIGRNAGEQTAMIRTLAAGLGSLTKLPLDPVAKTYAAVASVSGDYAADGLTVGQLTAVLRQTIAKSAPGGPLIEQVHIDGGFG